MMLQPLRRLCYGMMLNPTLSCNILKATSRTSHHRTIYSGRANQDEQVPNKQPNDTEDSCENSHKDGVAKTLGEDVTVTFLRPDSKRITVKAPEGKSLYDVVIDNNVDIDGFGACNGTLCCTTCQLIFKQADYEKVGEPSEEELDMLDLAYVLSPTSRLGCRVILKKELDPLEVEVPASINDVRES